MDFEKKLTDLEKIVAHEGRYAYIQNDPDLYVDLESSTRTFPIWTLQLIEKKGVEDVYTVYFIRSSDQQTYRPNTTENLSSGKAFEIDGKEYDHFISHFHQYAQEANPLELIQALWDIELEFGFELRVLFHFGLFQFNIP